MPRRSSDYKVPNQWVIASGSWPDGPFETDAPAALGHVVAIAVALNEALLDQNKSAVAEAARIERSTLYDILAGNTWPETLTLANLEAHLQVSLWPSTPPPDLRRET